MNPILILKLQPDDLRRVFEKLSFKSKCRLQQTSKVVEQLICTNKAYKFRHPNYVKAVIRPVTEKNPDENYVTITVEDLRERQRFVARTRAEVSTLYGNYFNHAIFRSDLLSFKEADRMCAQLEENRIFCNTASMEYIDPSTETCRSIIQTLRPKMFYMESRNLDIYQIFSPNMQLVAVSVSMPLPVSVVSVPIMIPFLRQLRANYRGFMETFSIHQFKKHLSQIIEIIRNETPPMFTVFQLEYSSRQQEDILRRADLEEILPATSLDYEETNKHGAYIVSFIIYREKFEPLLAKMTHNVLEVENYQGEFFFRVQKIRN